MKENWPQIIKDVGFDFNWDEPKVWKIKANAEEMDIKELEWHLDVPFLWEGEGEYNLCPVDVMRDPESHVGEYRRTMKTEMQYPIDIMENKGRWVILDGLHRLMKAKICGQDKVMVRKIDRKYIPEILK